MILAPTFILMLSPAQYSPPKLLYFCRLIPSLSRFFPEEERRPLTSLIPWFSSDLISLTR